MDIAKNMLAPICLLLGLLFGYLFMFESSKIYKAKSRILNVINKGKNYDQLLSRKWISTEETSKTIINRVKDHYDLNIGLLVTQLVTAMDKSRSGLPDLLILDFIGTGGTGKFNLIYKLPLAQGNWQITEDKEFLIFKFDNTAEDRLHIEELTEDSLILSYFADGVKVVEKYVPYTPSSNIQDKTEDINENSSEYPLELKNPNIVYEDSSDVKSYPIDESVITTEEKTWKVVADRAYFHNRPNEASIRNAYMVKGEVATSISESDNFVYIVFINKKNKQSEGYIRKINLTQVVSELNRVDSTNIE
ncbi:hypothetical protein GCM10023189_07080 [Nibrella saemangeumensis]|uniref:Uncharacterized protein n=1 Tax=Nibrella saemangeumensis TaxID=1084526 RepID=A0ABP8MFT6_9BACT